MHKKWIFSCFLLLLCCCKTIAQADYGKVIHSTPAVNRQMLGVLKDMQYHLQKLMADSILIDQKDTSWNHGICIIKLDRSNDTIIDPRLDRFNSDMFVLRSDGRQAMHIIAYSNQGITNGIYTYMDLLGFKWFHPGELWTHFPERRNLCLKIDSAFKPDFMARGFFGSFGTPRNEVIDKPLYAHFQWLLWAIRNRQGTDFNLGGHEWNNFLWRNLDTLKQHPEYMALVDSHRVIPGSAAKFCLSNKNMRQLFVNFEVARLKKDMAQHPGELRYIESVEPSDGYGDCQCAECKKMGTNSTRVFTLANETAKAFYEVSHLACTSMLAYNTHADTPDVKLEPNLLVEVIPYRYQRFYQPDSMIALWKNKKDTLFIYDYYGLPILNVDMPLKGALSPAAYAKRIKSWHERNIKGMYLETTCSIGSAGLGLYLFMRLGWQINSNTEQLLQEYYKLNYGKAADAMRRAQDMLGDTVDNRRALYNCMAVINAGMHEKTLKPDELKRINSYKAYLHYLKLLYDFKRMDRKLEPQMSDTLIRYAYSIFSRMMVSPLPLLEHMWNYGPSGAYLRKYWDAYHPKAADSKFSTVVQWSDEQVAKAFEEDYQQLRSAIPKKDRGLPGKPCCRDTEEDMEP